MGIISLLFKYSKIKMGYFKEKALWIVSKLQGSCFIWDKMIITVFYLGMIITVRICEYYSSFPVDFFIMVDLRETVPSASLSFRQHMLACLIFSGHYMWGFGRLQFESGLFLSFLIPVHFPYN